MAPIMSLVKVKRKVGYGKEESVGGANDLMKRMRIEDETRDSDEHMGDSSST